MAFNTKPLEQRFWEKVDFTDSCWNWTAGRNTLGYGSFKLHGSMQGAHRVAWRMFYGEVAPGFQLDHLCKNRRCVNVLHMEVVTQHENIKRSGAWDHFRFQTHCKYGHPLPVERTATNARVCKPCRARISREYRKRQKVAA